jgi:ketosteroid isomerase-like protein
MPATDRLQIIRECYGAYESGDRSALDRHLAENYTFFSPDDVGIDRERYFERCWPNHERVASFELERLVESGDEVFVTYESERIGGGRFRNTEIHRFDGDNLARTEVYYGWDLE